ncbi:PASTA domain-containing protein [Paraburkholderia sp. MMS20-SJTN17]|uniref:PASTA domain-containing protein n=1 Tax=Paraburkholderia translucens TaxID=2886945 RepID=A0ABS8K6W2_9BURK|nr:PASTA domain-containing protein [Paraburkholderia sp. MMS20-SJTN17]MCC8400490.1 PASTA domain-containing protein [Paraburkholderia sp. MMS20-SJTN17]
MAQTTFDRLRNLRAASLLTLAMLCGVALQDAQAACSPNQINCHQPSVPQQLHPVIPPQPRPIVQSQQQPHPVMTVRQPSILTSVVQIQHPSPAPTQPQAAVPVAHAPQSPNAAIRSEQEMPHGSTAVQAPAAHALTHSGTAQIARIPVPSLRGMSTKAAQLLLEHQHLSLAVMDQPGKGFSDEIIEQVPSAGTPVPPGTRVSVHLRRVEMRAPDKPEVAIAPGRQALGNERLERLERLPHSLSPGIEAGIAGAAGGTRQTLQYSLPEKRLAQAVPLSPSTSVGKPALQSPNPGNVTINPGPNRVGPSVVIGIHPAPAMPAPVIVAPMPAAPPAALAPVAPPAPPAWAASPAPPVAADAAPASPRAGTPSGADTQNAAIMAAGPGPADGEDANIPEAAGEAPPIADAQPPVQGEVPGPLAATEPATAADLAVAPRRPAIAPSIAAPSTSTENTRVAGDTSTADRPESTAKSTANTPAPPAGTGENVAQPDDRTQAAFGSVDRALDSMPLATAVFNVPTDIDVDEDCPCRIDFVLDARDSADAITALIKRLNPAAANFQHDRVRIYPEMEASLTAQPDDFSIDPGPEKPYRQAVSDTKPTTWTWYVTPKRWGVHRMRLALYARIPIEGKQMPVLVQTFDKNIIVTVTPWSLVRRFVLENWKWLSVTLLIPLGQFLWKNRRRLQPRVNAASVTPPGHHHRHHAQMHRHGRK